MGSCFLFLSYKLNTRASLYVPLSHLRQPTAPMLRKVAPANNQPYIKSGNTHNAVYDAKLQPASYIPRIRGISHSTSSGCSRPSRVYEYPQSARYLYARAWKKTTKSALFSYLSSAPLLTIKSECAGGQTCIQHLRSLSMPFLYLSPARICRFYQVALELPCPSPDEMPLRARSCLPFPPTPGLKKAFKV